MTVRHAWLALLATACSSGSHDAPAPPPPSPPPADARAPIDAAPAPDAAPVDPAPAGVDAAIAIDGERYAIPFGYATTASDGIYLTLTSNRVDCRTKPAYGDPKTDVLLRLTIPVGPGGTYYTGHWISTSMIATLAHKRQHFERAGLGLDMAYTNGVTGAGANINAEVPAKLAAGTHIKGELDAFEANLLGAVKIAGHFDLELCDAPPDYAKPLPAQAPAGPVHGSRGGVAFPKIGSVHAVVHESSSTVDNAIDVSIHRAHGDLPELFYLYFYAEPNVPCGVDEAASKDATLVVAAQSLGGTSKVHPTTGVAEPTAILIYDGERGHTASDFMEVWPAAIVLDGPLDYTDGARLRGAIWSTEAHYSEKKGSFGGHFEATVCHQPPSR